MSITSTLCFPGFGILFFPFAPRLQSNALVCGEKSNNPCNNPLTPSFYVNVFFCFLFGGEGDFLFCFVTYLPTFKCCGHHDSFLAERWPNDDAKGKGSSDVPRDCTPWKKFRKKKKKWCSKRVLKKGLLEA